MPLNAIATGLVDNETGPADMPGQLLTYIGQIHGKLSQVVSFSHSENALKSIFALLNSRTGHDFSQYKPNTIYRRIARRMAVHQIDTMELYVGYLQENGQEIEALFRDLLIGVTSFFRDSSAFRPWMSWPSPRFSPANRAGSTVRVWSTGCSTGEEAYSLAILFQERLTIMKKNCKVQIFATDIDNRAIAVARAGVYPASVATEIAPDFLGRYFTAEADGSLLRINKNIRDMLVFSEQNVIKDPPFSRLDLISCRNLLIYINSDMQKKLIPLFHYSLVPRGFLFLGTSETVGEFGEIFTTLDRKLKIYQRKEDFVLRSASGPGSDPCLPGRRWRCRRLPIAGRWPENFPCGKSPSRPCFSISLRQRHWSMAVATSSISMAAPGNFLSCRQGKPASYNIVKMAREGLQLELTTALHKVGGGKEAFVPS